MFTYRKYCKFFSTLPAENTREFELKVTGFAHSHASDKEQQLLLQIVQREKDAAAYGAFYCLTVIYRNRKNYQQLLQLLEQYEQRFAQHISFKHLKILYLMESDALYDYDVLLQDAYTNRSFMDNNAGYVHAFAFAFAVICEKQGAPGNTSTVEKWYDKALEAVERAIALDPAYAKYYCTKARILAIGGRYTDAVNLISHAISIEKSSRSDYALRIAEFQYYSLYIQIQQCAHTLKSQAPQQAKPQVPLVAGDDPAAPDVSGGLEPNNYLFISYSHKDDPVVHALIRQLQKAGIKVWYDKGLPLGPNYFDEIADELDNCQAMLLVLSANSMGSQYVRKELCFALDKRKMLIHANIDGVLIPSGVQLQIGDLQGDSIVNYNYNQEVFFAHLVKKVKNILSKQEAPV